MMPSSRVVVLYKYMIFSMACVLVMAGSAGATQLHEHSEGIIVHQIGHLFFLLSMVVLIVFITGKELNRQKGWRLIQISAFFFILWNLDAFMAHLLDNQLNLVEIEPLSFSRVKLISPVDSPVLSALYYVFKLDHLLCVPAMLFLYLGMSRLVKTEKSRSRSQLQDDV